MILNPQASVIMPVHRNDKYLEESIQSLLNQSFISFELILILNGLSADDISDIKSKYFDCRIKILTTKFNKIFHCLNLGIDNSNSNYIIRMDSDDIASPDRIEKQIKFMNENLDIGICGTFYSLIDKSSNAISKNNLNHNLTTDLDIKKSLKFHTTLAHPTIIARKNELIKCGGYSNIDYVEDWDLWLRAARLNIKFSIIPTSLLYYRIHSDQITNSSIYFDKYITVFCLLIREFVYTRNILFILSIFYSTYLFLGVKFKRIFF